MSQPQEKTTVTVTPEGPPVLRQTFSGGLIRYLFPTSSEESQESQSGSDESQDSDPTGEHESQDADPTSKHKSQDAIFSADPSTDEPAVWWR